MLKAFYGRYYNNIADSFTGGEPGGQTIAEYNFLDQNRNGRYDGPSELRHGCALRVGRQLRRVVDPDYKTPSTEEISASFETQLPGESSARVTYVRKNVNDAAPYYVTQPGPRVDRTEHGARDQDHRGRDVQPGRCARQPWPTETDVAYANFPDGELQLRHDRGRLQQAGEPEVLHQRERRLPVAQRLPLVDRHNGYDISTSPLSADPIGINYYLNANPASPPRQDTTAYHFQFLGRYEIPVARSGSPRTTGTRAGSRTPAIVPDCGCLNLSNYGADFFVEPLEQQPLRQRRAAQLPPRQELPDQLGQGLGDAGHLQRDQRGPGHELQLEHRLGVQDG